MSNRFTDEWGVMVSHAWLTHQEAVEAATKAGYHEVTLGNTKVTDGEDSYVLRFKSITVVPGLVGLVWYWDSEQEDNL